MHQANVIYARNIERGSDLGFFFSSNFVVVVAFVQSRLEHIQYIHVKKTLYTGYDPFHKRTITIRSCEISHRK